METSFVCNLDLIASFPLYFNQRLLQRLLPGSIHIATISTDKYAADIFTKSEVLFPMKKNKSTLPFNQLILNVFFEEDRHILEKIRSKKRHIASI